MTVVMYLLFMLLGKLLYFKGVIGINESSAKRESISSESISKKLNQTNKLNSYVMKEIRLLIRTPIYFMNCVLMNFFFPILIFIPLIVQGDFQSMFVQINQYVSDIQYSGIILAGLFAFMLFVASSNAVTATSISREGSGLYIMKYLPVSLEKQIKYKVRSGIWISLIAVVMILMIMVILKLPVLMIVFAGILSVNALLYPALTGIIIDMHNPKLNWDNEQAAVKQNLNVLFNMVFAIIGGAVALVPVILFSWNQYVTIIFITVLFSFANRLLLNYVNKNSMKLLMGIE